MCRDRHESKEWNGDTACACSAYLKKRREERGQLVRQRSSELRRRGRADGLGRGPIAHPLGH